MKTIITGSDFSGVGAFDQALNRLNIKQNKLFACDWDKYARQTYIYNFGEPAYYPSDVYDRQIPAQSLDIYMTSPPCQSFSLAGKRQGENSDKGILFYNSHEFIVKNKPRFFIFENVKGLLSDNGGKTFKTWIDSLGGKTVNGNPVIFPHENSVPYHVYHQVLNAKNYGVPQNRQRIFIIGIRDEQDNIFSFPKPFHLVKKLKDVLEIEVDEKYFLSEKMIKCIITPAEEKWQSGKMEIDLDVARPITATCHKMHRADTDNYISIHSNTAKGYDIAEEEEDSINFSNPNSETRRGRVGHGVSQTLETDCNQGVLTKQKIRRLTPKECFRLMDFNEDFKWNVSDSQAYKQAGNSIVVACLVEIIRKFKL